MVENIEVIQNIKFNTDHRMVRASIKISNKNRRKRPGKNKILYITKDQQIEYQKQLNSRIKNINVLQNSNIQDYNNQIEKSIISAVPKTSIKKKKENRESEVTLKLIDQRENLKKTKKKTGKQRIEYCEIKKLVKKMIKKDLKIITKRKLMKLSRSMEQ